MLRLPIRCAIVLVTAFCAGCTGEVMHAAYPDLAAAIADDAVGRGWIPAWIPASATEHRVLRCDEPGLDTESFLAMPRKGGQALFWRVHRR